VNDDFSIVINDDQVAHAQNNVVRILAEKGKTTHDHPVVYVENGSHEFFPTQAWKFYGAPNHNGKGFHYLAATPPNLGEIDHPLSETSMGAVITRYNGYWGTYGFHNTPPQGPPLHSEWTAVPGSPGEKLLQAIRRGG
jgi:hypothetical protein